MSLSELQPAEDPVTRWVTFTLDHEKYCVDVMQAQEVLLMSEITPVPGAAPYVLGIINLRGNVVTVVDTRKRFLLAAKEPDDLTRIVIIEAKNSVLGMLVDSVADVVDLRRSDIESTPNVGNQASSQFIQGVASFQGELLIIIDLDKFMAQEQQNDTFLF